MELIDREGWTPPKAAPGPPCPLGRLRGWASCAFRSLSFLFLLGRILSSETRLPPFLATLVPRDLSNSFPGFVFLVWFFSLHTKTFFACISEEQELLTLSITQHECSGDRGQRNWLDQGIPEHTARQPRWRLGMRLSPGWLMDVFRFSRLVRQHPFFDHPLAGERYRVRHQPLSHAFQIEIGTLPSS